MTAVKDILDHQIYPNIFSRLPEVFPEFGFKRIHNGYQSTTGFKVDGSAGQEGKVYVYENNISRFIDYTRGNVSIWDYLQQQKALTNYETLQLLARLAGVTLTDNFNSEDIEKMTFHNRKAQVWEEANHFFTECLNNQESRYAKEVEKVKQYLTGRGYLPEEITAMHLGYIPSQKALYEYLKEKGFSENELKLVELNQMIGETHKLTIPYREPAGRLRGISARNINYKDGDKVGKYLYSTGLKRDDILFNLRAVIGDKDLVLVEGPLDALIASARGFNNVAALGGTGINSAQVELAKRYGAKKITLALDNDEAGKQATLKAIDIIRSRGIKVYVATLPNGIKDPDQLIREQGIESFKTVVHEGETYFNYILEHITEPYSGRNITDKERDEIISAAYDLATDIFDPIDKEIFFSLISTLTNGAVTKEGFNAKASELRLERKRQKQERELNKLLADTGEMLREGKLRFALDYLNEGNKRLKTETAQDLIESYNYASFLEDIRFTPPTLKTGIASLDEFTGIPHGAITLIAGRPSHGKTTFMFNLMVNMSKLYPEKKFYFFSYEEQKKFILVKILNRLINKDINLTEYPELNTNLERLKAYLRDNRSDVYYIEDGKARLKKLLEEGRIEIIDKPYAVEDLANVVSYLHSRENIGAVFIDYIQRIRSNGKSQDKRVEIANVSDHILNYIAKGTGLPVILGAQFNRGAGESPKLEHLKEAGNLEEDANMVLSVYQEARENDSNTGKREVELEIKALKNRDGAVNTKTVLKFDRFTGYIRDFASTF